MSKISKKKIDKLIHSMALKNNMSDEKFKEIINSPYEFTKEKINKLDLKKVETEKEFNKLKTNFIYKSFFKLVVDYKKIKARNNRRKNINKKINNK